MDTMTNFGSRFRMNFRLRKMGSAMILKRLVLALGIGILPLVGQDAPPGKYLYCQPPPARVEFKNDEISLVPVSFPNGSPSQGIEVATGVVVPYGDAELLHRNKKEAKVLSKIKLRHGYLWFEGVKIDFGPLRVYKIREAYRWGEWVVCDGYTSASDEILKMPPGDRAGIAPSEIIYFKPKARFGKTKTFGMAPLSLDIIGDGSSASSAKR